MISQFFLEFLELTPHRVDTKVDTLLKSVTCLLYEKCTSRHSHRQTCFLVLGGGGFHNFQLHLYFLYVFK